MRLLNVHFFTNNTSLASYLSRLCKFLNVDKSNIEVKDDMAILEYENRVMVFTKNKEILLELSENCNCVILHFIPKLEFISKLMENNTFFIFTKRK